MDVLHEEGFSDEVIEELQGAIEESSFPEKDKALLLLAETLTVDPPAAAMATREAVRAGWSETEVAHAIFLVSYYNMLTRIVKAFDLPPDEGHPYDPAMVLPMMRCRER